jgi:hypothetical protein
MIPSIQYSIDFDDAVPRVATLTLPRPFKLLSLCFTADLAAGNPDRRVQLEYITGGVGVGWKQNIDLIDSEAFQALNASIEVGYSEFISTNLNRTVNLPLPNVKADSTTSVKVSFVHWVTGDGLSPVTFIVEMD